MLRLNKIVLAACVSISALTGAAFAQDTTVVAKVGDLEITQSELDLAIANLDPQLAQLPDEQKKVAALSGAIDVKRTSTQRAPWTLVEGNDKYFARLKVLETACNNLAAAL